MSALEKRKKLLAAEADVYREVLKLEAWNFKVYGAQLKRRARSVQTYAPLVAMGLPFAASLFRRRRKSIWQRLGSMALMAFQTLGAAGAAGPRASSAAEPGPSAAEEYLDKRI